MPATAAQRFPALQFARPWSLQGRADGGDLRHRITYDEQLLRRVMDGELGPCVYVARGERCLTVTSREARLPGFAAACEVLAGEGWPVVERCSGGACVPQGRGVLNLSVLHPKVRGWRLDDGYRLLCDLLADFLAGCGVTAVTGEVPGSFCDGRYNLQVGGRKLVGTAQRWAGGSRERAAVLAHACLLVDLDLAEATDKVNRLYELCGRGRPFDPQACTTLRDGLGDDRPGDALVDDLERALVAAAVRYFGIHP